MFKKKYWSLLLALVLVLSCAMVAGCEEQARDGQEQAEQQQEGLSGSFTIAGSTSVKPLSEELARIFMEKHPDVKIHVHGGGSTAGIRAAYEGAAEIGSSSRDLKPEEKDLGLKEFKIAGDGIAVVVHPENAVEDLTVEQVRKIFSGEITNWKEVGGSDAKIGVVSREEGSGTRGSFEDMVMKYEVAGEEREAELTPDAAIQNSTGAVRATVAGDPNAIGYMSLGYVDESVKAVKIDGVEPTVDNILAGKYEIARPFLYLTKGEPEGVVKAYIDWVLSEEGQAIIEGEEFIRVK